MPISIVDLVRQTLEEIADMYHNGFHVPIASSIVDLHLWLLHENDLIALGLYPSFFNYRELEIALEKEVGLKTDVPFVMNWVQNGKDPEDGYYEFQIINSF